MKTLLLASTAAALLAAPAVAGETPLGMRLSGGYDASYGDAREAGAPGAADDFQQTMRLGMSTAQARGDFEFGASAEILMRDFAMPSMTDQQVYVGHELGRLTFGDIDGAARTQMGQVLPVDALSQPRTFGGLKPLTLSGQDEQYKANPDTTARLDHKNGNFAASASMHFADDFGAGENVYGVGLSYAVPGASDERAGVVFAGAVERQGEAKEAALSAKIDFQNGLDLVAMKTAYELANGQEGDALVFGAGYGKGDWEAGAEYGRYNDGASGGKVAASYQLTQNAEVTGAYSWRADETAASSAREQGAPGLSLGLAMAF